MRVLLGEAVGYAYTEDLVARAMRRAAETAAKIAARGDKAPPVDIVHYDTAHYYAPSASTIDVRRRTRSTCCGAPTPPRATSTRPSPASTSPSSMR